MASQAGTLVDLPAEPDQMQCLKCLQSTSLSEGAVWRGQALQCKNCTNIYQMIFRNVGGVPPTLQKMTPQAQASFFKSAAEHCLVAPKNGRWASVRSSLISHMVTWKTEQTRVRVRKEYLPLNVWKLRGFCVEDIVARGEKQENAAPRLLYVQF